MERNPQMLAFIREALEEDLGTGDVTTEALVPPAARARARIVARTPGCLSGGKIAAAVFRELDADITIKILIADGAMMRADQEVMSIEGKARAILSGERTALNLLQRMTGIATETARYVDRVRPHRVQILDTRKTTPLLRSYEKYAVRCGGGVNHRMGLYDRIMIKDNHLAFWVRAGAEPRSIADAIRVARKKYPDLLVELEVDRLDQLDAALVSPPDWILLDNMSPDDVRQGVIKCAGKSKVEVSGGITLESIADYAAAGPDAISVGALTHTVQTADLSLEWLTE